MFTFSPLFNFWDPDEPKSDQPLISRPERTQIDENEELTAAYFEKIKKTKNENALLSFLNEFLYADPHVHFQGMLKPHHWKEIVIEAKLNYDPKTFTIIKKAVTSKPCSDFVNDSLSKAFEKTVSLSKRNSHESKSNISKIMESITPKFLLGPFFRELKDQNINYAEPIIELDSLLLGLNLPQKYLNLSLSFDSPSGCAKAEDDAESILKDYYFERFIKRFEDFFDDCEEVAKKILGTEKSIFSKDALLQIKFKAGISRVAHVGDQQDPLINQKILFAQLLTLSKLIQKYPNKICSFDLIGPEDSSEAEFNLFPQLQMIHYLTTKSIKSKKEEELNPTKNYIRSVSVHVGELNEESSVPRSVLNTRVNRVVNNLKSVSSLTLSHLNSWIYDSEKHGIIEYVKSAADHRISLMTLPISDKINLRQTPFNHISHFFIDHDLMDFVLVGSDMPGYYGSGISQQYLFLIMADPHYFDYYHLRDLMINPYERTHLEGEGIYFKDGDGHYHIKECFKKCLLTPYEKPYEAKSLLENSEKAQREWEHLESIYKVEKIYAGYMKRHSS